MFTPFFDINDRFRWMGSLERQMDRILTPEPREESATTMFRDVGDALVFVTDLPGVKESDIEITLEGDILTLRAEASPVSIPDAKLARAERPRIRLFRKIELPVRVSSEEVKASLIDGVLTLTLPKAAEARPRKIPVSGSPAEPSVLS